MNRSRAFWFFQGIVAGLLIVAAANSISYFFRSDGWGKLLAETLPGHEALGFPFEIWQTGKSYSGIHGGGVVDDRAFVGNILFAVGVGSFLGMIAIAKKDWLNRFLEDMIRSETNSESSNLQFSLGGMLRMTAVAAVIAGLARASIGPRPELLAAIFLLGPLSLILVAMVPKKISWEHRVVLLVPSTILLIGFAVYVGGLLEMEFDRMIMAIFICWVPQTVGAAILLTTVLAIRFRNRPSAP